MNTRLIRTHPLFQGLGDAQFTQALSYLDASEKGYPKGAFLNRISMPLTRFGLVLSGVVMVAMNDLNGNQMIMASVKGGDTFGESLCYLGVEASVLICAATDVSVLWLSTEKLKMHSGQSPLGCELCNRFTAMLANRTLSMNERIQILSKKSIRDKLLTFFSQYASKDGGAFTIPFERSSMAAFLGCDRSALSRELSNMQAEGILQFQKNEFQILNAHHETND
ncbi:MAG: Crp/Fnr family transcriptional regulator [Clostridia bacterium]